MGLGGWLKANVPGAAEVAEVASDVGSGISDAATGVSDYASEKIDAAREYVAPAAEYVAPALDYVTNAASGVAAAVDPGPGLDVAEASSAEAPGVGSGLWDRLTNNSVASVMRDVVTDNVPDGSDLGTLGDILGNNIVGFVPDILGAAANACPLTGAAPSLVTGATGKATSAVAGGLGQVLAPIAAISGFWGASDDLQNRHDPAAGESSADVDWNSLASNFTGGVGGLLSTVGLFGGSGAGAAGAGAVGAGGVGAAGAAGGGLLAAAGTAGSVVGAAAAGLLGGHYLAKAGDSDHGHVGGKTSWDHLVSASNGVEDALGGGFVGKGVAVNSAAYMAPAAGLVGGGAALVNWLRDL